ncbi:MAG: hypothetical protein ACM33B_05480 [Pseudomonadota bacterium]
MELTLLGPRNASVAWRTSFPAAAHVGRGLAQPTIWSATSSGVEHEAQLGALEPGSAYVAEITAVDAWGRTATAALQFETPPATTPPTPAIRGDTITFDDQPVFLRMTWEQCDDRRDHAIAYGITTAMAPVCEAPARAPKAGDGSNSTIVPTDHQGPLPAAAIGRYYPDEWDTSLPNDVREEDLRAAAPVADDEITFLTLTNHFYSHAEPLAQGRGMYPALVALADVVGFDLYPLQVWCRDGELAHVFLAQQELERMVGVKPTYQWIEVKAMEHCPQRSELAPTAATVRAETWLAVAGGADAIGYFPNTWDMDVGSELARTNRELTELAPALLAPDADATSDTEAVRVGARTLNGAVYVIAVNTTRAPATARIGIANGAGRLATVLGESRQVEVAPDNTVLEQFEPLAVHLYVLPPLRAAPPHEESDGVDYLRRTKGSARSARTAHPA